MTWQWSHIMSLVATCALLLSFFSYPCAAEQGQPCRVQFPPSYYVTTGTTIPMTNGPPIAQSGALYVDGPSGRMRMDQFFGGRRHSFIADTKTQRAYIFQRSSYAHGGDAGSASCRVFSMKAAVEPLCVPTGFASDTDLFLVRGVPVSRFVGFDRHDGPLLQVEFFLYNSSAGTGPRTAIPWRIQTRVRPNAELREIAGAPFSMPNWRFFGEPMFDEVAISAVPGDEGYALDTWLPDYDFMTVDFYNFVPSSPDASVFDIPEQCAAAESAWTEGDDEKCGSGACHRSHPLLISTAQRFLIGWSFSNGDGGGR